MEALVAALQDPETRENALLDLSKKRDMFTDLAPILWHSFGTISALLQEIVAIYPLLSPPSLTAPATPPTTTHSQTSSRAPAETTQSRAPYPPSPPRPRKTRSATRRTQPRSRAEVVVTGRW